MAFRLRPAERGFYPLFSRAGENILAATADLARMVAAERGARAGLARRVKEAELAGDGLTHDILVMLNSTFVTPFDREDIHRLTAALDDVVDAVEEAAARIVIYRLGVLPPGVCAQVESCAGQLRPPPRRCRSSPTSPPSPGTPRTSTRSRTRPTPCTTTCWPSCSPRPARRRTCCRVLALKEVVDTLEDAADAFEKVANTVESIAVKES